MAWSPIYCEHLGHPSDAERSLNDTFSVQAFTLPGSMYISILFGAAYGMVYGLFLSCIVSPFRLPHKC